MSRLCGSCGSAPLRESVRPELGLVVAGTEPKGFLEVPVRRPSTNACARKEDSDVAMPSLLVAYLVLLGPEFSLGQIEKLPLNTER